MRRQRQTFVSGGETQFAAWLHAEFNLGGVRISEVAATNRQQTRKASSACRTETLSSLGRPDTKTQISVILFP